MNLGDRAVSASVMVALDGCNRRSARRSRGCGIELGASSGLVDQVRDALARVHDALDELPVILAA